MNLDEKARDMHEAAAKIIDFTGLRREVRRQNGHERVLLGPVRNRLFERFIDPLKERGTPMHELSGMNVTVKKETLLATLQENRERHKKIVAEAREGYLKKAEAALRSRLDVIRSGKMDGLIFGLSLPVDQTKVYDTAIRLLEVDINDEMELTPSQVRNLVMDEWDWTEHFAMTNSAYSDTAAAHYGRSDD
jgi:hypothetical protein